MRLWYTKRIDSYKKVIPVTPHELVVAAAERYIDVYERITGEIFAPFQYPLEDRIRGSVLQYLAQQ